MEAVPARELFDWVFAELHVAQTNRTGAVQNLMMKEKRNEHERFEPIYANGTKQRQSAAQSTLRTREGTIESID